MAVSPDLSALSTGFGELGGKLFRKNINTLDLAGDGILVYKNVKAPIFLPRISASGGPRPYREQDDTTTPVAFEDRVLTVYQSKWDFDVDPEKFRNTYLAKAKPNDDGFVKWVINTVAQEYLAQINDNTLYLGVRDAAGTGPEDLADGWGTIIAAEITASNITPVVTGAITDANAVAKVKLVTAGLPTWLRKKGGRVYCSYSVFDMYATNYASTFGFQFMPDKTDRYRINNTNFYLWPVSWMGTSQRLIASPDDNLIMGTDGESVQIAASVRRNIVEVREMMPVGFQISDLDALVVNDQA